MTLYYLASATPLPEGKRIDGVHLDNEMITAQSSDAIPGGFGGFNLSYASFLQSYISSRMGNPIDFVDLGHLQFTAGDEKGFLCFEGRVATIDTPTGLQATGVTATGYGAGEVAATTDMWYFSEPYDGEPTVGGGQLLREILQASAPLLHIGDRDQFYEPGGSYLRSGANGRYPTQAIDEVTKAGDSANNQVLFSVYEDRVVRLLPRVPPVDATTGEVVADYYVPADREHVSWRRSSSLMVGVVAVQFQDSATGSVGYTAISSSLEQQRFRDAHGGLLRGYLVPSSNWTQAQAEFYRDSYLQKYKNPVLTCMVKADPSWPVYDREGGAIPAYMVRSGGWLKVADQDPIMITSTRKDYAKEAVSFTATSV